MPLSAVVQLCYRLFVGLGVKWSQDPSASIGAVRITRPSCRCTYRLHSACLWHMMTPSMWSKSMRAPVQCHPLTGCMSILSVKSGGTMVSMDVA